MMKNLKRRIMRKFNHFIFLALCLLLACNREDISKDKLLTDEDKSWNIYHVGDTIKLLSNFNHKKYYRVNEIKQGMYDYTFDNSKFEYITIVSSRVDTVLPGGKGNIILRLGRDCCYNLSYFRIVTSHGEFFMANPFDLINRA